MTVGRGFNPQEHLTASTHLSLPLAPVFSEAGTHGSLLASLRRYVVMPTQPIPASLDHTQITQQLGWEAWSLVLNLTGSLRRLDGPMAGVLLCSSPG